MDLVIRNGMVIDGSGRPGVRADVAIEQGKIKAIGDLGKVGAREVVDATGMVVAPGFIDILNHSDSYLTLLRSPMSESMLAQGVTTVVVGNCGASLAPFPHGKLIAVVQKWGEVHNLNVDWERFGEFLDLVEKLKPGVNVASLVGHATLRRAILEDDPRPLNDEEMRKMRFLLEEALSEGAFGLSFAPAYAHARVAPEWEIEELLKPIKEKGRYLAMHLRHEDDRITVSLEEAIAFAKRSGVRLEISHFKVIGGASQHLFPQLLERVHDAAKEIDLHFDIYPYEYMSAILYTLLPEWAQEGGLAKMIERAKHAPTRDKILKEMEPHALQWADARVLAARRDRTFIGKTLGGLASIAGISIAEAALGLFIANDGRVIVLRKALSADNLSRALADPRAVIGSAGAGYNARPSPSPEVAHPRSFGTFPKVLGEFVRDKRVLGLEVAIARMTKMPAEKIGLTDRGELKEGMAADIVVFDPVHIKDLATFENPWQLPEGIHDVIVNGVVSVDYNGLTGSRSGKVLRAS